MKQKADRSLWPLVLTPYYILKIDPRFLLLLVPSDWCLLTYTYLLWPKKLEFKPHGQISLTV